MRTAIIALMLLTSAAHAEDIQLNKEARTTGLGLSKCSEFMALPDEGKTYYLAYATGYTSAFNLFNSKAKQYTKTSDQLKPWLEKYCFANPTATFVRALADTVLFMN